MSRIVVYIIIFVSLITYEVCFPFAGGGMTNEWTENVVNENHIILQKRPFRPGLENFFAIAPNHQYSTEKMVDKCRQKIPLPLRLRLIVPILSINQE